jgi:hypothetical protein
MKAFMAVVISSTLFCTAASAASSGEQSWAGPGMVSCAEYAKAVRLAPKGDEMRSFFFSWAQGFISGVNTLPMLLGKGTNLTASTTDAKLAFIEQFCEQRPMAAYVQAVIVLYDTMRQGQGLHDWRAPVASKY